ncbi:hypothetical protein GCM10027347_61600 [Larkinella harenae]
MKSYKLPLVHNNIPCEVAVSMDEHQATIVPYVNGAAIGEAQQVPLSEFEGSVLTVIKSVRNFVERRHPTGPTLTEAEKTLMRLGFIAVEG